MMKAKLRHHVFGEGSMSTKFITECDTTVLQTSCFHFVLGFCLKKIIRPSLFRAADQSSGISVLSSTRAVLRTASNLLQSVQSCWRLMWGTLQAVYKRYFCLAGGCKNDLPVILDNNILVGFDSSAVVWFLQILLLYKGILGLLHIRTYFVKL